MRIALVQQPAGPDKTANIERGLSALAAAAEHGAHLVCFAELAFEPFYPQRPATPAALAAAETIPGPLTEVFRAKAEELGIVVVLNLFERDGELTYDSSPVIDADGRLLGTTRMIHITEYACFHEQGYYAPGNTGAPVYDTAAGRLGVAICYDRHYPEYMRALALQGAELVVVPQAGAVGEWPDGLYEAEMRVAAFQNGYFTALCNRVGQEDCLTFAGESFVCAADGSVVARAGTLEETILYADIDLKQVPQSHARKLFLRDRRPELYGAWLCPIQSDSQRRGILQMTAAEYFDLVDGSGRMTRSDKRGAIDAEVAPMLLRIGAKPEAWLDTISRFGCRFRLAAGQFSSLRRFADQIGSRWVKGIGTARAAFASAPPQLA